MRNTYELYPELERLSVENLFSNSDPLPETGETMSEKMLNAFKALPNGLAPDRQLSLLRVVATFPAEPDLRRKRISGPPVAVLKTETFKAVTEPLPRKDLIETLVLSMHGKRSLQYVDTDWKTVESFSSKRQKTSKAEILTKSPSRTRNSLPSSSHKSPVTRSSKVKGPRRRTKKARA
ncbi:hypothetical protein H0H92_012479 [Tricholoma furcatifolium]|nr:hypothetical protein H0H92_012479 [Tricholoma furcatifolium]